MPDYLAMARNRYAHVTPPPLFSRLLALAESRQIAVTLGIRNGQEARAEFVSSGSTRFGCTKIIVRSRLGMHAMSDRYHAILFAHELGHHRSWTSSEASAQYRDAAENAPADLLPRAVASPSLAADVLVEEARAWCYAREELAALGFTNWERFFRLAGATFATYATALVHVALR